MLKRHSISNKPKPSLNSDIPSCYSDTHGIITSTTNTIPNHRITRNLGTIFGLTCRARNWGAEIGGALKSAVGGELRVFTNMMYTARNEAMDRMIGECMGRGGNAVVGLRFDVASEGGWCQVCAYGTAVVVETVGDGARGGQEAVVEEDEGDGTVS